MKIRQGFVSNSSSSSFCIIGYKLECENSFWGYLHDEEEEFAEQGSTEFNEYDENTKRLAQILEYTRSKDFSGFDLDVADGIDTLLDSIIIGRHIRNVDENKSIKEIKQEICDRINEKVLNTNKISIDDINIYIDGGFEG